MPVNNAGRRHRTAGVAGAAPDFGVIQRALDTNFLDAHRQTVSPRPLVRASEHPGVVSVPSGLGAITEMGGWSPGDRVSSAASTP